MNTSLNQLCVIDGEYKINKEDCVNRNGKLTNLIESYQLKLKNNQIFDSTMNSTLTNNDKSANLTQRFTNAGSSNFVCFIISDFDLQNDCVFLKLEETQAKLSSMYNSFKNTASTTLTNSAVIQNITNPTTSNSQISFNKRFLIFGWPVLDYCSQNNIVSYYFLSYAHLFQVF